jgi:energy-coupling factor transporter ATP-binding protein EcfA2
MLQQVTFQNFTGLPNATWALSPGLNVIVGENGLGKSHFLKAVYALLRAHKEAKNRSALEKAYADKLMAVFRPESLGRLVKRKQGRARCEIKLDMQDADLSAEIAFATNAKTQVDVIRVPADPLRQTAAFLPTRELVTLCPWFVPLYDGYHVEFDETWRDTVSLLGLPTVKGPREREVAAMIAPLEEAIGGKVLVDSKTGKFYLQIPGEGQMEMPLVAEGLRKVAMLVRLISTGALLQQGYLFWDEPEANLNPKLQAVVARSIVALAQSGIQVFVATHSLFLLRELDMLTTPPDAAAPAARGTPTPVATRFFALSSHPDGAALEQGSRPEDLQTLVLLDEELRQSDRFMDHNA